MAGRAVSHREVEVLAIPAAGFHPLVGILSLRHDVRRFHRDAPEDWPWRRGTHRDVLHLVQEVGEPGTARRVDRRGRDLTDEVREDLDTRILSVQRVLESLTERLVSP